MANETHNHYNGVISLGTVAAVVVSWLKWHSVGWAIVHGLLGWLYVIYYLIRY